jgi:intracellular sulfur oxidation DsrE/DsrF family protein
MKDELRFTDKDLHRYIDGEMDEPSRADFQALLDRDPSLAARVRRFRSVDQAIREAFDAAEPPAADAQNRGKAATPRRIAAALMLPVGFLAGWLGHSLSSVPETHEHLAGAVNLPVQGRQHLNTLFHIDVDESAAMGGVLDRAEAVLTAYAEEDLRVEVVANAAGLNLLRSDTSEFAPRVRAMMEKYDNLTIVACANTIKKLEEQGVEVVLIDRTHARETAIDHVVDRLQDGWTYIKI